MMPLNVLEWAINLMKDALEFILAPVMEVVMKFVFQPILDAFASAVGTLMSTIATFWVYVPTIPVGNDEGQPANDAISWVWDHTQFIALFIAAIALIVGAMQMAWTQRGESARELLRSLITLAVASAFAIAVAQALITAGDMFSSCIISTALDSDSGNGDWVNGCQEIGSGDSQDFGRVMTAVLGFGAAAAIAGSPLLIGIMIAIGVLCVLASLIQIVLMVVRSAMLVLLLGVLPIAAAATNTEMGRNWFKRIVSWLLAFILYKPVAAIVYATAIRLVSNNGDLSFEYITEGEGLMNAENIGHMVMNVVTGLTMLILALFAMPALMRFIVPMVGATAGAAGAGMIAAKMVGADKVGDMVSKGAEQGSDGGGGGGGDGPTGAENVGKAPQQAPSTSGGASGAEGAAAGSEGAAAGGATGGATAGATGGSAAGGAAAGGATAGVAAVAAPVAVAAVAIKVGKAVADGAKEIGNEAMGDGGESGSQSGDGGGGGGDGGGPSGSGGGRDLSRERDRAQRDYRDDDRDDHRDDNDREPDGPSGSG